MHAYLGELIGTAILILLGNGVVANVVLKRTKGENSGWIVITAGWACAVFVAVLCAMEASGAHLNSAVTVALALSGNLKGDLVAGYLIAQLLGAMLGAALVYAFYKDHFDATEDKDAKLGCFCTGPAIRMLPRNLFCEAVGTFVLVYAVLLTTDPNFDFTLPGSDAVSIKVGLGSIGAARVGLIVFAIGLSLGGTTGYAINPARDLGPRLMHAILPIRNKRDNDWGYAWVPVLGPLLGGVLAVAVHQAASQFGVPMTAA